ncbi:Rv3654c family TadE-like protein [Agromyces humatus]|uniref:Helicase n=1 Tax=Agromyces humatus TaxID=279573 RepID=A0ABN2K8I0_9MICO|nr:Rv3654c family TadE-like protein [Agromyces humatus]
MRRPAGRCRLAWRDRASAWRRRAIGDDSGAATVVALGLVGAIVALAALLAPTLGVLVATQRVANAADAAALAAADATSGAVPGVPCDLAASVAARNGATLTGCEVDGPVASVTAQSTIFGFAVVARARAGPPGWEG